MSRYAGILIIALVFALAYAGEEGAITIRVRVEPPASVAVTPPPGRAVVPGRLAILVFTVKNVGDSSDVYRLSASSTRRWRVRPTRNYTLRMAPGAQSRVAVLVTVPSTAAPGSVDRIALRAQSVAHADRSGEGLTRLTVVSKQRGHWRFLRSR